VCVLEAGLDFRVRVSDHDGELQSSRILCYSIFMANLSVVLGLVSYVLDQETS